MTCILAVNWLPLFQENADSDIHEAPADESKDERDGGDAPKQSEASIENPAETKFEEADVAAGAMESAEAQSG